MKKQSVVWFMLALLTMLAVANICWAVEEDEDGNIRQSQPLALDGDESVAPKPKVIIKERVVMRCAPGSVWSPKNKRCISEDGEAPPPPRYQAPAPRQQAEAPRGDRYVYPGTKLRVKMGECTMKGETVVCHVFFTNTHEGETVPNCTNITISDEYGSTYKVKNWHEERNWNRAIAYGVQKKFWYEFPLVDPKANSVSISMLVHANNGSDTIKFAGIPVLK